jgi:SAM-dependent MidA family methyltransferase
MNQDSRFQSQGATLTALPPPDPVAREHSARLQRLIAAELAAAGGRLSFARFMELALYAPGLGYYSGGSLKLGAEGDFITAPESSPLFARCLARQVAQVLTHLGDGDVLEVGAGSGQMAADLLAALAASDHLPNRYFILERSGELRARQQALLQERLPQLKDRIQWLEQLPGPGFRGVIIANELLDALPVHCFTLTAQGAAERYVQQEGEQWRWCLGPVSDAALTERINVLRRDEDLFSGYSSEINLAGEAWVRSIADVLAAGMLLVIDYGFPRREYYHPQRSDGTLMCHYRHRAHDDPLILVGLQDITAHVDFTAMAAAGHGAGLEVAGYTTQGSFLLATGITELLHTATDEMTRLRWAQQIKKLTLPHEMGELFKVLAFARLIDEPLMGFTWRDLRDRL